MWLYSIPYYLVILFGILTIIRWILKRRWGSIDKSNEISAKGKIVVVTGATAGIGKYTALEFARRQANVILACRNMKKAANTVAWIRKNTTLGQLICMELDLESLQSVKQFAEEFKSKYNKLDILVNNAGLVMPVEEDRKTDDGFEIHFGVNHLGHFLLTNLLLRTIKKCGTKVVIVSSMGHSWAGPLDFDDLNNEKKIVKGSPFANSLYCRSKLANALFNTELSRRLEGTGVRTYALCPGMVSTDIGQNMKGPAVWALAPISPIILYLLKTSEEGAQTTMYCALSKNLSNESGQMYIHCAPWNAKDRITLPKEDAQRLWDESMRMVKAYL